MRWIFAFMLMTVMVIGCHTPTQREKDAALAKQVELENVTRRLHYLEGNPELPPTVKKAIAHGEVVAGMTESDVRASIGEPDQINTTQTDHGSREQWYYQSELPAKERLNFEDGTLTSWHP